MELHLSQNWLTPGDKLYDLDGDSDVLYSVYEPFGSHNDDKIVNISDIEVCPKCKGTFLVGQPCPLCNIATYAVDDSMSDGFTFCVKEVRQTLEARIVIVDTICEESEFGELKKKILDCMDQLDETPILLISLHADGNVKVHGRDKTVTMLVDHLRISYALKHLDVKYFAKLLNGVSVMHSYRDHFTMQLLSLKASSYNRNKKKRAKRATGFALFLASLLADSKKIHYQIISFLSGPCTIGPGKVISRDIRNTIRHFNELENRKNKYFEDAVKFYRYIADSDKNVKYMFLFASLNQVGIYEMSPIIRKSSIVRQFDSFTDSIIDETLEKYIILKERNSISNIRIKVNTSEGIEWKPNKAIPMSWNYLINKNNISVPIKLRITSRRETKYMVQVILEYNREDKRYCKVNNSVIVSERPTSGNLTSENVLLAGMVKEIAWNNMNESYFSTNIIARYKKVLKKVARNRKEDKDFLFLLYNTLKFGILDTRNISPDQRITISHEVAYSSMEKILLMIKPRVLKTTSSSSDVEEVHMTSDLYNDPNIMLGIDAGNMFMIRESESADSLALRMKIDNWHKHRELNDLAIIPLIKTKPGTGQDRYFKNKLIPLSNSDARAIHTEELSFEQFLTETM